MFQNLVDKLRCSDYNLSIVPKSIDNYGHGANSGHSVFLRDAEVR